MSRLRRRTRELFQEGGWPAVFSAAVRKVRGQLESVLFRPYQTKKRFDGEEYRLLIPDPFAKAAYDRDHEWPELRWVVEHLLREGDHAVDVGANIGFTSIQFARGVGLSGKVTAIEALPRNAKAASSNARLNNCSNIEVLNVAAGASVGAVDFLAYPNGAVGRRPGMKSLTVPMTTLDTLFGGQHVDFIKIDVEGYELEVLKGARQVLASGPALDLEFHCALFSDPEQAFKLVLNAIQTDRYVPHVQMTVDGEIKACDWSAMDLAQICSHEVVHLLCYPKARGDLSAQ